MVGRDLGGLFGNDAYLSPRHATFTYEGDQLMIEDDGSLNGVYRRIDPQVPVPLEHGSIFRLGQEVIRFEVLRGTSSPEPGVETMGGPDRGYIGRIRLVLGRETYGNSYCIPMDGLHLGRERGDIVFPDDGYVSGVHCRVYGDGNRAYLMDVGSSNGTFIRVHGSTVVPRGSLLLLGQQLFRAEY